MKKLSELAKILDYAEWNENDDTDISGITFDSRAVAPGVIFVCIPGSKFNGHDYVADAEAAGAAAIIAEKDIEAGVPVLYVKNSRNAMRDIAPAIYDYPARSMRVVGLTGTNGKTTTTYLLKAIFGKAGHKCGIIGTIQSLIGEKAVPVKNTTPDAAELQWLLGMMRDEAVRYVFMEVSSHALELGRTDGCEFDVALFTNLTQDHLDFHGTLEKYRDAKAKLFAGLGANAVKSGKSAVLNNDDPASRYMKTTPEVKVISYAVNNPADVCASNIDLQLDGCSFDLVVYGKRYSCSMNITGMFNVYNVLAAVAVAVAEGVDVEIILAALREFEAVPGRFELVKCGQPFAVAVDYAHTPDGLENVLKTAMNITQQRVITVFGCGGDRDRTKRPVMGGLAASYSDVVIATSDNPRSEEPELILDDIEQGISPVLMKRPEVVYERITDRAAAIARAIDLAKDGDVVIIAGKGHETYQILKDRTIDFDDHKIAEAALRERVGMSNA